jgi:hypothetical protein
MRLSFLVFLELIPPTPALHKYSPNFEKKIYNRKWWKRRREERIRRVRPEEKGPKPSPKRGNNNWE